MALRFGLVVHPHKGALLLRRVCFNTHCMATNAVFQRVVESCFAVQIDIPRPETDPIDPVRATAIALANRLDLQSRAAARTDADRQVLFARNQLLPQVDVNFAPKKGTPAVHTDLGDLFLPMDGLIDVAAERERRTKEKEQIVSEIQKVEQKLANPAFTQKVPESVLLEHPSKLWP